MKLSHFVAVVAANASISLIAVRHCRFLVNLSAQKLNNFTKLLYFTYIALYLYWLKLAKQFINPFELGLVDTIYFISKPT